MWKRAGRGSSITREERNRESEAGGRWAGKGKRSLMLLKERAGGGGEELAI